MSDVLKNIGLVPVGNNPSTAQLILPGMKHLRPVDTEPVQLTLPFKKEETSEEYPYCNDCIFLQRVQRPNKNSCNTKCTAESPRPGGSYRVIKLNVYPDEKIKKPFWCPCTKEALKNTPMGCGITRELHMSYRHDTEGQKKRELWLGMSGITSWAEIKVGQAYHLPPTLRKGRMDILITGKYGESIEAEELKTTKRIWLYKQDEEYKFLSEIK